MNELKGLSDVLRNLNKETRNIQRGLVAGLTESALVIKRVSVPYTPIQLGNLRGSAFILVSGGSSDNSSPSFVGIGSEKMAADHPNSISAMRSVVGDGLGDKLLAVVAYSAFYAWYVHEMPGSYNFNSGSNKFLERAVLETQSKILGILKKHARVK